MTRHCASPAADYRGAGTVEFLVDVQPDEFYFLEMNARIQVEHPVTEMVTGRRPGRRADSPIAEGGASWRVRVSARQGDVVTRGQSGCAIECRINAEDPANDFMPSPGTVSEAIWPAGEGSPRGYAHRQRVSRVPPFYDSLLGKIIAHGPTARPRRCSGSMRAAGRDPHRGREATNLAFQRAAAGRPAVLPQAASTPGFPARSRSARDG